MRARLAGTARHGAAAALAVAILCLTVAGAARGSDRIYWENSSSQTITFATLDGSDAGTVALGGAAVHNPFGLAIDSASQRIYWGNAGEEGIDFANLFGVGGGRFETGELVPRSPVGIAIDPGGQRLYWSDGGSGTLAFGELDGSLAGHLATGAATVNTLAGVAVDPIAGRLYWANINGTHPISFANLDGSGGGDLNTAGATASFPTSLAVDRLHGRVYWTNFSGGISFANLDGSGGGNLPTGAATVSQPRGVAIDPEGGRIYWANSAAGSSGISFANLDGSGGGDLPISGVTPARPGFPVLLFAPRPNAAPIVSGGARPGSALSCSPGGWGADLPESFLYRAPQSFGFQWSRDGVDIAGATAETLSADSIGSYACRVTARNRAGEATQSSALHQILPIAFGARTNVTLKLLSHRLTRKAPVVIQVSNANPFAVSGKLSVAKTGKQAASRSFAAGPGARVVVRKSLPRSLRQLLSDGGRLAVTVRAAVADLAGNRRTVDRHVVLRRKR